jgi:hypothetical protein
MDTRERWRWGGDGGLGGVVRLLIRLDDYGACPVLHVGGFLGLRGRSVRSVPDALWHQLQLVEPLLAQLLRPEPTPYRRRRGM